MSNLRYCRECQDYIGKAIYGEHMKQHNIGQPNIVHKQYSGVTRNDEDYMICILHQKKLPCPVNHCNCIPFGMIKKSWMMKCAKGIIGDPKQINEVPEAPYLNTGSRKVEPFFPYTTRDGKQIMIPIDMKTRTVILLGVPIHLKI